ncbi:unnamed protein product [Anisakis simplex]|uniref:Transmembrane protein 144 (inferred by orthology to a human protein) n=1 Tax=Anisakis simplex TaxID=6269 RepID=A0A0M3KAT6_ANISI|nr:unnamed protein product [Anisakis simplex]
MMGIAIIFVGFIVLAWNHFPPFYPLPMLGGLFWGVANSTAIMLTEVLGLALALLIWNTVSCIMGWATSRFGLFGTLPEPPKSDLLNYLGLVLLVIGSDHHAEFPQAPENGSAYVFSYFTGILLTTSSIFIIYSIAKRGRPMIYRRLVLPSLLCGAQWAVGMTLLFVANDNLSQTIAYPIITVLPGGVAALWSVLYFREIKVSQSV